MYIYVLWLIMVLMSMLCISAFWALFGYYPFFDEDEILLIKPNKTY